IPFGYSRFPGVRVKPLCHLSTRSWSHPEPAALNQLRWVGTKMHPPAVESAASVAVYSHESAAKASSFAASIV
ncbi:MAG TPA: hypothetical protein VH255_02815, partial [Verrucomicrobiae bacterium]|nr:hypothetical protein [Verrucomicrobiae bacterium]